MPTIKSIDADSISTRSLVIKSLRSEVYPSGTIAYSDGTGQLRFSTLAGISPSYIPEPGPITIIGADLPLIQSGLSSLSTGIGNSYNTLIDIVTSINITLSNVPRYPLTYSVENV